MYSCSVLSAFSSFFFSYEISSSSLIISSGTILSSFCLSTNARWSFSSYSFLRSSSSIYRCALIIMVLRMRSPLWILYIPIIASSPPTNDRNGSCVSMPQAKASPSCKYGTIRRHEWVITGAWKNKHNSYPQVPKNPLITPCSMIKVSKAVGLRKPKQPQTGSTEKNVAFPPEERTAKIDERRNISRLW